MNTSGQVSVELKLMLDSLKRQVKQAADILKAGLGQGSSSLAPAIEKAGKETDNLTAKTKKAVSEARALQKAWLDAIRAGKDVPGQRPINVNPGTPSAPSSPAGPGAIIPMTGGGTATQPPYLGPVPPVIPSGGGSSGTAPLVSSMLVKLGLAGAAVSGALASVRVAFGLVRFAANAALAPLRALSDQFREAASLYAKALQGGAGMGYHTAASSFADIIGVSEQDVFRYGDAIKRLNERIGGSIQDIARVTPNLTGANWEFKAMKYNFHALGQVIANDFAPAMRSIHIGIGKAAEGLRTGWKKMSVGMDWFTAKQDEMTKKLFGKAFLENSSPLKWVAEKLGLRKPGDKDGEAGAPTASHNRLAGSSWERMGFVIGRGSQNHAAQTAANTKRIATLMATLVSQIKGNSTSGGTIPLPSTP